MVLNPFVMTLHPHPTETFQTLTLELERLGEVVNSNPIGKTRC